MKFGTISRREYALESNQQEGGVQKHYSWVGEGGGGGGGGV